MREDVRLRLIRQSQHDWTKGNYVWITSWSFFKEVKCTVNKEEVISIYHFATQIFNWAFFLRHCLTIFFDIHNATIFPVICKLTNQSTCISIQIIHVYHNKQTSHGCPFRKILLSLSSVIFYNATNFECNLAMHCGSIKLDALLKSI